MKWLFASWETKVIAFTMAVVLFYFTRTQITETRSFTVDLSPRMVEGLPEGYVISEMLPTTIGIEVSGPVDVLGNFDATDVAPRMLLSATSLNEGRAIFDLGEVDLSLPPSLRLQGQERPRVTVDISRLREVTLPVDSRPDILNLAEGLETDIALDRTDIRILGPSEAIGLLNEAGRIGVQAIDVGRVEPDIQEPTEIIVNLNLDLPRGVRSLDDPPVAKVVVRPQTVTRTAVGPLPVGVLAPPDFHENYIVELATAVLALEITGPRNLLDELRPAEQIRLYVDLMTLPEIDVQHQMPVRVVAPSWVNASPTQVRLRVTTKDTGSSVPVGPTPGEDPQPQPIEIEDEPPAP